MKIDSNEHFTYVKLSESQSRSAEIFRLIRKKSPISRSDISKETGITLASISHYMKLYLDKKLVTEVGYEASTGGRRAELIKLNNEKRLMGIAVLRNSVKIVMCDLGIKKLTVVEKPLVNTKPREVERQLLHDLEDMVKDKEIKETLLAAGVGIEDSAIGGLAEKINNRLGITAFEGLAASAGAYAENLLNDNTRVETMLYIYSDLGGCAVVKGDEIMRERESGSEYYLTSWHKMLGIEETARRIASRGIGTLIVDMVKGDPQAIDVDIVAEAASKNDDIAQRIVKSVSMNLGVRAAYLVNLFAPDVVVVGMSSSEISSLMLDGIKDAVSMFSLKELQRKMKIISGALDGDAVSLGAAALAAREIFIRL